MDRPHILNALGLPPETPLQLTRVSTSSWGRRIVFRGVALPDTGSPVHFELLLSDCRDIRWQVYTHLGHDEDTTPPTSIVSFRKGRSPHRSPAYILTEHFGLAVFYGELEIRQID